MNRDRRATKRREYPLRVPSRGRRPGASLDPDHVAPWVIAEAQTWPTGVEDSLVAVRMGVQPQHVQLARRARHGA
jgi:hypothetical protein